MENEDNDINERNMLLGDEQEKDYVTKSIGAFGLWQARACLIAACTRFIVIWNMLSIIFLTPVTDFICVRFPQNISIIATNSTCYDSCIEYEFHNDFFEETLISEFQLICDSAWKASFTQTVLMFGFLVGVWLFGWISDRFGRRLGLLISSLINILFMLATPYSINYWMFNCLRFFVGLASGGGMVISLVYIIEIVGPSHREAAGALAIMPDGVSEILLAYFAYCSPNWRIYLLKYSIFSIFIFVWLPFLPESPRWLMSKGKTGEAIHVMTKAAKRNNLDPYHIQENVFKALDDMLLNGKELRNTTYLDLIKTKKLTFKTIFSIIIWTSCGICYFGINQYITFIGTNVYLTVILLGIVQIPTCPLATVLNKIFGRKSTTMSSLFVIGVAMSILMFVPPGHIGCTILGIIGFAATCTTFTVLCVYVSELFPTPLRTMAYGASSGGAKIGAMVAPFIATVNPHWIPSLIFSIMPFISMLLCFVLPETKGRNLQDTFDGT